MLLPAGAGVSAESGIPTFRGAQGLWRSFDPMELGEAALPRLPGVTTIPCMAC